MPFQRNKMVHTILLWLAVNWFQTLIVLIFFLIIIYWFHCSINLPITFMFLSGYFNPEMWRPFCFLCFGKLQNKRFFLRQ